MLLLFGKKDLKESCSSVVLKRFAVANWARIEISEYLFLSLQKLALILVTFSERPFCNLLYLRQFNVTMRTEMLIANFE